MAHAHAGHSHGHGGGAAAGADSRRLLWALGLITALMAVEIAAGVLAHSLALLSDAAHMLTDAAALGLSLLALRLARRPAGGSLTFGLRRVEILSAQVNGVALLILAAFIVFGAVGRLISPPQVRGGLVLAVAIAGALVNIAAVSVVAGSPRRSLAVEGSFQHLLTDLYAFIATAIAALVIIATGFDRADPIASLLIAALMLRSGARLVLASGRVFLEAAPVGVDPDEIGRALVSLPGVVEVHDLHVWELTSAFPALSAHVLVARESDCHAARRGMEEMLADRFSLRHTTLQVDHDSGGLLAIEPRAAAPERG